eukprot:1182361-Prorocentrum_minimum.AAC.2
MSASGSVMAWMYVLGSCAVFGRARACCTTPSFDLGMESKSILLAETSCGLRLHSGLYTTVHICGDHAGLIGYTPAPPRPDGNCGEERVEGVHSAVAPPRLDGDARRLERNSLVLGVLEETSERSPEWSSDVLGIDLDQGDELVVFLVVPCPQIDDVVYDAGVDLVEERLRSNAMDVSGVDRQLGVVRMVDQSGGVEVDVLDEDRSSDNTNGVLAVGSVGEGRAVVMANIKSKSRSSSQLAIAVPWRCVHECATTKNVRK